jgi:hypothetical protein
MPKRISVIKRAEFVSDSMLYIILRSHWYHIILLGIHAPTEDRTDYLKESFQKETGTCHHPPRCDKKASI